LDFELIRYWDMTAGVMPVTAPHGKGFYVAVAVFASLFGFLFVWGTFASGSLAGVPLDTPMVWRLVSVGIAAIFVIGAMQAFERLLAPARAQARSAAISDVARGRLLTLRSVLVGLGGIRYLIASVMHLVAGSRVANVFELSALFIFAGFVVADFCGKPL
jgi:hypothetical protein